MVFCKYCGAQLKNETKFCHKCGKPVDSATNDWAPEGSPAAPYNDHNQKDPDNRNHHGLLIAVILIVLSVAAILIYVLAGGNNENREAADNENPDTINVEKVTPSDFTNEEDYQSFLEKKNEIDAERIDADEFFKQNSQIVNEVVASESQSVYSETDIFEKMKERGFTDYPVTTDYTMGGKFLDVYEVSGSSSDTHPVYQTSYADRNGEVWCIYVVNDAFIADPVSYNLRSEQNAHLMVSESETITSYDSYKNKFYETIPNASALTVITVDRLDSQTLDELDLSEIAE